MIVIDAISATLIYKDKLMTRLLRVNQGHKYEHFFKA